MKVMALDLSGIHDKRSLHMLIPLIRPRKLILTGGTKRETDSLAEACRTMLAGNEAGISGKRGTSTEVLTPIIGMTVDASVDTNAWTIKLDRKLYKQLQWQEFRTMGIVTVKGRLVLPSHDGNLDMKAEVDGTAKRQKIDATASASETPTTTETTKTSSSATTPAMLPVLTDIASSTTPTTSTSSSTTSRTTTNTSTNQALHVGDLRLAELRRIMQAHGHSAEFKGEGTLLVDGVVAVRKSGIGKIEVEAGGGGSAGLLRSDTGAAAAGGSFWDVKRKIYEGLAVVAAR